MRIRTVKPAFWSHELLSKLDPVVHMLAAALLNYADDEGYFNAHPDLVKASTLPLRDFDVVRALGVLSEPSIRFIRLGTAPDRRRYGHIVTFREHQNVNRPTPSKIKRLSIQWDTDDHESHSEPSPSDQPPLTEGSSQEGNGREGKGESAREAQAPPSEPRRRAGHGDPFWFRPDPTAAAFVVVGEGRVLSIAESWARKARDRYALTPEHIDAFATWLGADIRAAGGVVEDGGHWLRYLDQRLDRWRAVHGPRAAAVTPYVPAAAVFEAQDAALAAIDVAPADVAVAGLRAGAGRGGRG